MYDWPKFPKQAILDRQPENWGTHWYGLTIHRNILESKDFKLKVGLGYLTEYRTFRRPFNGCLFFGYDKNFCPDVLWFTNGYKIKMVNIPIDYSYHLFAGLNVNIAFEGNFSFYKNPMSQNLSFKEGYFQFNGYSFTAFPGISYDAIRFRVKLDYRAFQYRKIDQMIWHYAYFRNTTPNPAETSTYETYNPAHFRLTLSYEFGKREFQEER